jgi:hypothetical protein
MQFTVELENVVKNKYHLEKKNNKHLLYNL